MSRAENEMFPLHVDHLHTLFSQLNAEQVETFYTYFKQWQLEQQCMALEEQRVLLEQQITENQVLMELTQPSPIALATLTRLQSLGVDDVDLLDTMLERGDTWLDHTLQLLEQCERLDVIHGNYTEWCQHALEGAYNWLDSIHEIAQPEARQIEQADENNDATEALLLQKLMSEDETVNEPVGTDVSRPLPRIEMPEGRDESVPTEVMQRLSIPSMLSYAMTVEENSVEAIKPQDEHKKSPRYGLMSRILASVWRT